MYTLKQVIAATSERIRKRSREQCYGQAYAVPKRAKADPRTTSTGGYVVESDDGTKYREFQYRVKCTDGWRKVAVRFFGPLNVNTPVWCWCSCPYFKYHCEVALSRKGSSAVVQSNGQRPRFTNPKQLPYCCKHVYMVFALALRKRPTTDRKVMGTVNQVPAMRTTPRQPKRNVWRERGPS